MRIYFFILSLLVLVQAPSRASATDKLENVYVVGMGLTSEGDNSSLTFKVQRQKPKAGENPTEFKFTAKGESPLITAQHLLLSNAFVHSIPVDITFDGEERNVKITGISMSKMPPADKPKDK